MTDFVSPMCPQFQPLVSHNTFVDAQESDELFPSWQLSGSSTAPMSAPATPLVSTSIFEAAKSGAVETIRQLLLGDHDAAAGRSADGATPLHLAAQHGHLRAVCSPSSVGHMHHIDPAY
jgi:ankyrin repeat protein